MTTKAKASAPAETEATTAADCGGYVLLLCGRTKPDGSHC